MFQGDGKGRVSIGDCAERDQELALRVAKGIDNRADCSGIIGNGFRRNSGDGVDVMQVLHVRSPCVF